MHTFKGCLHYSNILLTNLFCGHLCTNKQLLFYIERNFSWFECIAVLFFLSLLSFTTFSLGNFPRPKINDDGRSTECVSIYVSNSNDVSIIDNSQLTKGTHYTVEQNATSHLTTGYLRLRVKFLDDRLKLFSPFKQIDDDLQKKSLYYYVTFKCQAVFGTENVSGEYRVKAYYEGLFLYFCSFL